MSMQMTCGVLKNRRAKTGNVNRDRKTRRYSLEM